MTGDVAVMLRRGSRHADPLFEDGEGSAIGLERADIADRQTRLPARRYGTAPCLLG